MKISKRTETRISKKIYEEEFKYNEVEIQELRDWMIELYTIDPPPCIRCPMRIFAYCAERAFHCPTFTNYSEGEK